MKILIWNINQRANIGDKDSIPAFIVDTLLKREPLADFIILTEFAKKNIEGFNDFVSKLEEKHYKTFISNNNNNNILIAIRKEINIMETFTWQSSYGANLPDYIDVTFSIGDSVMTIVGARILVDNYKYPDGVNQEMQKRYMQNRNILDRILLLKAKGNLIIGGGDFNTGRRNNKNIYWNKEILAGCLKSLEINLITPEGYSHEIHKDREYRGCPDHFFASNTLKASTEPYNWDFTYNNEYDEYKNKEGNWVNPIKNPYPDHGIIIADVLIQN